MRAMRLISEGHPLAERDVDVPPLGPRAARVRVGAAGVCHSDLHLISGAYDLGGGRKLSATGGGAFLPLTPGHEVAGTVEALGEEVDTSRLRVGDPVIVYPWIGCGVCRKCIAGRENLCEGAQRFLGFMRDGGFAESVGVPDAKYLVNAEGLEPAQAATLACSGLTAFTAVRRCAVGSDDLLLVIGAGGVGTTAIQIAKRITGARVVVADVDATKLELAEGLGADAVVDTGRLDAKGVTARIRSLNGGRGADAVIDFVGNPETSALGFRALGRGARMVVVGLAGGSTSVPLPMLPLLGTQIIGNFTGAPSELIELVDLAKRAGVRPVVAGTYPLADVNEVLARLARGEIRGRAALRP